MITRSAAPRSPPRKTVDRRIEQHEQYREPRDIGRAVQRLNQLSQGAQCGAHGCSFRYRITPHAQAPAAEVMTFVTLTW